MEYTGRNGMTVIYDNGEYSLKDSSDSDTEDNKNDTENEKSTESNKENGDEKPEILTKEAVTEEATTEETTFSTIKIRDMSGDDHYISSNAISWESLKADKNAVLKPGNVYRQGNMFYVCIADEDVDISNAENISDVNNGVLVNISESTTMYTDCYMRSLEHDFPDVPSVGEMKYSGDEGSEEYYICKKLHPDHRHQNLSGVYYEEDIWKKIDKKYFYMK